MSSILLQRLAPVPQPKPPYEVTLIVEGQPSRPEEVHPDLPGAGEWSLSAGDGVQEIVFEPPSENETLDGAPLRLMFDMTAADVSARVLATLPANPLGRLGAPPHEPANLLCPH